ncbi:MAG: hypothetical protein M1825_005546 [Sarcosagium campestre]|nr:MAG: hypothetical protein M1825_005546 [Sarcosagium campestre]
MTPQYQEYTNLSTKVNWDVAAKEAGYKDEKNAKIMFGRLKKKLENMNVTATKSPVKRTRKPAAKATDVGASTAHDADGKSIGDTPKSNYETQIEDAQNAPDDFKSTNVKKRKATDESGGTGRKRATPKAKANAKSADASSNAETGGRTAAPAKRGRKPKAKDNSEANLGKSATNVVTSQSEAKEKPGASAKEEQIHSKRGAENGQSGEVLETGDPEAEAGFSADIEENGEEALSDTDNNVNVGDRESSAEV